MTSNIVLGLVSINTEIRCIIRKFVQQKCAIQELQNITKLEYVQNAIEQLLGKTDG